MSILQAVGVCSYVSHFEKIPVKKSGTRIFRLMQLPETPLATEWTAQQQQTHLVHQPQAQVPPPLQHSPTTFYILSP